MGYYYKATVKMRKALYYYRRKEENYEKDINWGNDCMSCGSNCHCRDCHLQTSKGAKYGGDGRKAGGTLMFYLGVAAGYWLVFPLTLRFLAGYQLSTLIPNQISLDSYIDNFMMLVLVMGIVFELPVAAWMLGRLGVLRRGFFHTYRRHAIVALLIFAAVVTPTGDPFTLAVVFLPIYILWEGSALTVPSGKNKLKTIET